LVNKQLENPVNQKEAKLFVGWVSGSVTHAGVGFHASTQPTFILYLINSTHPLRKSCQPETGFYLFVLG